jgi:hypothetical protein
MPFDPETALLREIYEGVAERARHDPSWARFASREPTPADRRIFDRAIADATAVGLRFTRPALRWVFERGTSRGRTERVNGTIAVYLNLAMCATPAELYAVAAHELAHVSDLSTGRWDEFTKADREFRAVAFSARLMERWSDDDLADAAPAVVQADAVDDPETHGRDGEGRRRAVVYAGGTGAVLGAGSPAGPRNDLAASGESPWLRNSGLTQKALSQALGHVQSARSQAFRGIEADPMLARLRPAERQAVQRLIALTLSRVSRAIEGAAMKARDE